MTMHDPRDPMRDPMRSEMPPYYDDSGTAGWTIVAIMAAFLVAGVAIYSFSSGERMTASNPPAETTGRADRAPTPPAPPTTPAPKAQ
jgi:hypothetical protein